MRPEGWNEAVERCVSQFFGETPQRTLPEFAESVADAMLEGLKQGGFGYVDGCVDKAISAFSNYTLKQRNLRGYLVFIPEEQERCDDEHCFLLKGHDGLHQAVARVFNR